MELYTRNAVKYSFLLSCIDRMLNYGLKASRWYCMLTCKVKWFLPYSPFFFFFFGGGGGGGLSYLTAYNYYSNYDRNKIFAVLKQSGNYLFQIWYVKRINPL